MKDDKDEKQKSKKKVKKSKKEENKEAEKALFIQRLFAYLIDIFIISFVASLIALPFIDAEQYSKYSKDLKEMTQKYTTNEIKPSHLYDFTASATCFALGVFFVSSPAGWIAGAVFLGAEVVSYAFTGQSVGEHLNNNINWSYKRY